MNGTAYFFLSITDLGNKFPDFRKITGELIIHALIKAIFMCIQNASAGARNTRDKSGFCAGINAK
jgi:hypothetical protein